MTPPQSATARVNPSAADPAVSKLERPTPTGANAPGFGSDVIAEALRSLDFPYIALTPGASYRGLHDSLVNYLGNSKPQMLLCLHEEAAVAIAQGYAKVTGRPMADRGAFQCRADARHDGDVQRLVRPHAGAGAGRHRPGRCGQAPALDRLDPHRARPGRAGAQLHQVGRSAGLTGAARESIMRAHLDRQHRPQGPVYINLDAGLQEMKLSDQLPAIDPARYMPQVSTAAPAELIKQAAAMLKGAKQVLILVGRASRQRGGLERTRRACRSAGRARSDRSENRRQLSDRPCAVCRIAARAHAGQRRGP